jgi:hypothetical protein
MSSMLPASLSHASDTQNAKNSSAASECCFTRSRKTIVAGPYLYMKYYYLPCTTWIDWIFFCEQTWIDSAFLYSEGSIDSAVPIECCLPIGLLFMLGLGPCVEPSEHLKGK